MIKGVQAQLFDKAKSFDLNRVEQHKYEYADCHAHSDVGIGRWHNFLILNASKLEAFRHQVDWKKIHQVHQEKPDKNRERQRSDQGVTAVKSIFNRVVDKLDNHFYEVNES